MVGESKYLVTSTDRPLSGSNDNAYQGWDASLRTTTTNGSIPSLLCATMDPINSTMTSPTIWTGFGPGTSTFGSYHPGGANMALADGSVHFVSQAINLTLYQSLGPIADGTPIGGLP